MVLHSPFHCWKPKIVPVTPARKPFVNRFNPSVYFCVAAFKWKYRKEYNWCSRFPYQPNNKEYHGKCGLEIEWNMVLLNRGCRDSWDTECIPSFSLHCQGQPLVIHASEDQGEGLEQKEETLFIEEDRVRHHLVKPDIYKSSVPDGLHSGVSLLDHSQSSLKGDSSQERSLKTTRNKMSI